MTSLSNDDEHDKKINNTIKQLKNAHILLVEDNKVNQLLASKLLSKYQIQNVKIANNGQEAIELIEKHTFDGILMDCMMPVMDGYEATRIIRGRESSGERIPIVALTANASEEDRKIVVRLGAAPC